MIDRVAHMLSRVGDPDSTLRPTELFNEGWMLLLLLDWASRSARAPYPLTFFEGARWFSEALLRSQFLPRTHGDLLAESWTHADGVIGHFTIGDVGRGDLAIQSDARQFVAVEAKMFSGLAPGVRRVPDFDQAARYVACVTESLARAERTPRSLSSLAFYVIAPQEQIDQGVFGHLVTRESIQRKVRARVTSYGGEKDSWYTNWFLPTLDAISLNVLAWESLVKDAGPEYVEFYRKCLIHNRTELVQAKG